MISNEQYALIALDKLRHGQGCNRDCRRCGYGVFDDRGYGGYECILSKTARYIKRQRRKKDEKR